LICCCGNNYCRNGNTSTKKIAFFCRNGILFGMNNHAQQFKEWMDSKKLRAKDVCKRFGVSEQTIAHWRSKGVPARKQPHVNYVIACWENPTAAELGSTLLLKPSAAQFRAWNQAALNEGQLLEQWAIEGLDQYAGELGIEPNLKVAEDPTRYGSEKKNGTDMGNG
jgi:transcriptional regulator with XRE-family HTH domain